MSIGLEELALSIWQSAGKNAEYQFTSCCEREGVSTVNVNHPLAAIHKEKEKCGN